MREVSIKKQKKGEYFGCMVPPLAGFSLRQKFGPEAATFENILNGGSFGKIVNFLNGGSIEGIVQWWQLPAQIFPSVRILPMVPPCSQNIHLFLEIKGKNKKKTRKKK